MYVICNFQANLKCLVSVKVGTYLINSENLNFYFISNRLSFDINIIELLRIQLDEK
jgi:hypothetical protein